MQEEMRNYMYTNNNRLNYIRLSLIASEMFVICSNKNIKQKYTSEKNSNFRILTR